MIDPVLAEMEKENKDIKVCVVDCDECPELAQDFNVASIPYQFVIKEGKVTNRAIGYHSKNELLALLK